MNDDQVAPFSGALLTRDEVRRAIHRAYPPRVPLAWLHLLRGELTGQPAIQRLVARYPEDVVSADIAMPAFWEAPPDDPDFRWAMRGQPRPPDAGSPADYAEGVGILDDYAHLDDFLAQLPDPERPHLVAEIAAARRTAPERYILGHFWAATIERARALRGSAPALIDLHDHPAELHRLFAGLTALYRRWIARMAEAGADGVIFDDDLGTQRGPLISPRAYRALIKPYHAAIVDCIHAHGMDAWFHSCGDVTCFLDDFVAIGLDVLHPLQYGTMDWALVAERYGDRLAFLVGMDMQQTLQAGTPAEIVGLVQQILDCFGKPRGGLLLGAGNLITADTSVERIATFWRAAWDGVRAPAG